MVISMEFVVIFVVIFAVIVGHSVSIERIRVLSMAVLMDIDLMVGNVNLLVQMLDQDHI